MITQHEKETAIKTIRQAIDGFTTDQGFLTSVYELIERIDGMKVEPLQSVHFYSVPSFRDELAQTAMRELLRTEHEYIQESESPDADIAARSYRLADAMLSEREKGQSK